ncbi:MAG TPA: o-succinylbenzoate synthase [Bryobacteraceae bacterium]
MTASEIALESGAFVIAEAELYQVSIPMHEPFRISSGEVSDKEAILLRIGDGHHVGWGECSAMGGAFYSSETPETCYEELFRRVLPPLLERQFSSMLALEQELEKLSQNRFIRAAVETAAWDLIAQGRNVSLRQLFQIPERSVPSGLAVGLYRTDKELESALRRYNPRQYRRLKLKIEPGFDLKVVGTARKMLGDFPLFVDANAAYDCSSLSTFGALDDEALLMFEQPFAKDDLDGLAELQRNVRTPVCLDESIETAEDAERFIAAKACAIVNIKLQRVGGYLPALRIMGVCSRLGIPLWMGTMPELGIGSAQALVLAAHPLFVFPTDVEPSERWYVDDLVFPEITLSNGCIESPAGPGTGYRVDRRKLDKYATSCHRLGR